MNKLTFKWGVMFSGKSLHLFSQYDTCQRQNKRVALITPALDTRDAGYSKSRALETAIKPNLILSPDEQDVWYSGIEDNDILLVDEAQFLSKSQVDSIRKLTKHFPVFCFGLRSNWKGELFEGSKRLMELADELVELKSSCMFCVNSAKFNLKTSPNIGTEGIDLTAQYFPVCYSCWVEKRGF